MKKFAIAAVTFGVILSCVISAHAETVKSQATVVIAPNLVEWTNFSLGKFDARLGTLTGVTITIKRADLQGSFKVTPLDSATAYVSSLTSYIQMQGVGFTLSKSYIDEIGTNPVWSETPLTMGSPTEFTIATGSQYPVAGTSRTITSGYWNDYISSNGTGTVVVQAKDSFTVALSAGTSSQDVTKISAPTEVEVTYSYDAFPDEVPESSTWVMILGGVGMLAVGQRMHRRHS